MRDDPRTLTRRTEVGQRLRELRRTRGLTQGELARAARLGQATLSNYEVGRRDILLDMAERVAEALEVTFGYLLDVPHVWVIRDPELARAVRILADSEELLTSIVGPRPPPPPRRRRRRRRAQPGEGEAAAGGGGAEGGDAEAGATDREGEATEGEATASDAEAGATDVEIEATDDAADATNGEDEAAVANGEADTTDVLEAVEAEERDNEVEAGEAEPRDNEVQPDADAPAEREGDAEAPNAGAEA